ncbi:MAG TPA: choice-of-anchor Q domain-containing protein, partial [Candidatus Dormibacteraeota bacterium]|nr:choice-of-anchor Q domain-containing protein [Candidatus Dormibacteraeota bacterium]
GGLFNRSSDGGPGATVSNCVITSNSCDLGFGGGIYNEGNLSLFDCTLNGNWVSGTPDSHGNLNGLGGGIHNNSATAGRTLLLSGCTISSNSASILGGGIANIGPSDGSVLSLALVSSTFSGNSAAQGGGGLYNGNYHFATTSAGTIIVNTIMDSSSITNAGGIVASLGNNLSSDHGGGLLSHPTDQTSTPPMLGPLQNNGGQAFTHAPLPGSPAIDKGKNFNGAATDQRGFARTINMAGIPDAANGDGTDIGAVEWQDASPRLVNAGIVSNQFGFNVTGPFTNIVLEYSTDPGTNWTVLGTYPLSDSVLRYNEFTPPVQPKRFYRARIQ